MAYVWQIVIATFYPKSIIKGVILNARPNRNNNKLTRITNVLPLIRSYTTKPLKNAKIKITLNEDVFETQTNNQGAFFLEVLNTFNKKPIISVHYQKTKLDITQNYPIFFKNNKNNIGVISDIDDTILASHTADIIKRLITLVLVPSHKRKTISFTEKLLNVLALNKSNIYYVSKSESNLFGIISSFMQKNKLPKGPLLLTPFLNFKGLLKHKKGKDFKLSNIKYIIQNSPIHKKFILFGDDTQKDMEVYSTICNLFPDRIALVYIRQTKKKISRKKLDLWKNLKHIFPNAVYFNKNTDINSEIEKIKTLF